MSTNKQYKTVNKYCTHMFIKKLNNVQKKFEIKLSYMKSILEFTLIRLRFIATKSFQVYSFKFILVSLYYTYIYMYIKSVLIVNRGRGYIETHHCKTVRNRTVLTRAWTFM